MRKKCLSLHRWTYSRQAFFFYSFFNSFSFFIKVFFFFGFLPVPPSDSKR